MPTLRLLPLLTLVGALACGGDAAPPPDKAAAAAVAREAFESTAGGFSLDLPGVWHDGYKTIEHADTSDGARFVTEFMFKPDAAWKVEPRRLLAVRIFTQAAWAKILARPGQPIATKVGEKGDDVFAYSVPGGNPYKPGTPAAARFDELVLAVVPELRLTVR